MKKVCKKYKVVLEYTSPLMHQLNGVIERIFAVIEEEALALLLNMKLNYTAQKKSVGRSFSYVLARTK